MVFVIESEDIDKNYHVLPVGTCVWRKYSEVLKEYNKRKNVGVYVVAANWFTECEKVPNEIHRVLKSERQVSGRVSV
jgi:hypothetical protein